MATDEEAKAAIALHAMQMEGRTLTVNEARPQGPWSGSQGDGLAGRGGKRTAGNGCRKENT
jgi:hypothetical protein